VSPRSTPSATPVALKRSEAGPVVRADIALSHDRHLYLGRRSKEMSPPVDVKGLQPFTWLAAIDRCLTNGNGIGSIRCDESSRDHQTYRGRWMYLDRTRGSHRQYRHNSKKGVVTIAGKPSDDLAPGTQNSILKQAGLK